MDIYQEIDLQNCPNCGGTGILEEENGYCWYVMCMDCGAQTAPCEYHGAKDRVEAARKVAHFWNIGKTIRPENGE